MRKILFLILISLLGIFLCKKKENKPPETPKVFGPSYGYVDSAYEFKATTFEPEEESVAFRFDFGDGNISNWTNFIKSGETIKITHSFSQADSYYVKAQAKDIKGNISYWSFPHSIYISERPLEKLWEKNYGGTGWEYGYKIKEINNNYFIVGEAEHKVYLLKVDRDGNLLWEGRYGPDNGISYGYDIIIARDGNYLICGATNVRNGRYDAYLIKVDNNGNLIWERIIDLNDNDDYGCVIKPAKDDSGYIIFGYEYNDTISSHDIFVAKVDEYGYLLSSIGFGGRLDDYLYDVLELEDGYLICGFTESYGAGGGDVYLVKTNFNGEPRWDRTFGGVNWERGYSIKKTNDNSFIICGTTQSFGNGSYDVYVLKVDENGNLIWQKTYGGTNWDEGYCIDLADNGYIITGFTRSFGSGNEDIYVIKIDENGNLIWQKTYGGSEQDKGECVIQTGDGYLICGYTWIEGKGFDVYLLKLRR